MSVKTRVAVLLACFFITGCSKTSPGENGSQPTAAKTITPPQIKEEPRAVVHAAHLESLPVHEAPALIEGPAITDPANATVVPPGTDRALSEAVNVLRTRLAVVSHNLANAETVAFKRSRVLLEDGDYQQIRLPGAQDAFNNYAPLGVAVGHGCRIQSIDVDFSQGEFETTNRALDLAIDGDGFFQVIDPTSNEFLYTRAGNFAINSNGALVVGSASTGRVVQPQISLPIDFLAIVISAEGNVAIQQFAQNHFSQIGQFQLARLTIQRKFGRRAARLESDRATVENL